MRRYTTKERMKFTLGLFIFFSLFNSWATSANSIADPDDMLVHAFQLKTNKNFEESLKAYEKIISLQDTLSFSQKVNAIYGALELTYVLKKETKATEYGHNLILLTSQDTKYQKVKDRLMYRLCKSEDWDFYRYNFKKVCNN